MRLMPPYLGIPQGVYLPRSPTRVYLRVYISLYASLPPLVGVRLPICLPTTGVYRVCTGCVQGVYIPGCVQGVHGGYIPP